MLAVLNRTETALTRLADGHKIWPMLAIAFVSLMLSLPGFFELPAVDRDESRFSQSTKQMVETGDFIDIREGEGTRYKKPIGIYWLQSVSAAIAGPDLAREIWVYRIPSVVSAIIASLLTYGVARVLMGPRVALLAGVMMATTLVLGAEARQAKTDAALLASITAAQLVLARLWTGGSDAVQRGWVWVFWAALAASVLIKGPIGVMVVTLTVVGLICARRGIAWLAPLRWKAGLLVFLLIVLPWYIAISLKAGSAFWDESLGRDMLGKVTQGQENHGAPPGTYVATMWLTFWPAALLLPFAFAFAWRERSSATVIFCLAWLLPTWIIFEIVATKLLHYTLPTYPALAVLAAAGWLTRGNVFPGKFLSAAMVLLLALGAALTAVPLVASFKFGGGVSLPWVIGLLIAALGACVAWRAIRGGYTMGAMTGLVLLSLGVQTTFWAHLSRLDYLWPAKHLATIEANTELCDGAIIVSAGFEEPSLRLQSQRLPIFTTPAQAANRAENAPCALVYVTDQANPAFTKALTTVKQPIAVVDGMNLGNSREVSILVYQF
jgi:4-amino-4-deoxy-L-arabinose transferase-like glycosyltransferase